MSKLFAVFVENEPYIEGEDWMIGTELNHFSKRTFHPIFRLFTSKEEAMMYKDVIKSFDGSTTLFDVVETSLDEIKEMKQVLDQVIAMHFNKSLRIVLSYWGEFWPVNVDLDLNQIN